MDRQRENSGRHTDRQTNKHKDKQNKTLICPFLQWQFLQNYETAHRRNTEITIRRQGTFFAFVVRKIFLAFLKT
jgi:hypothetical protein